MATQKKELLEEIIKSNNVANSLQEERADDLASTNDNEVADETRVSEEGSVEEYIEAFLRNSKGSKEKGILVPLDNAIVRELKYVKITTGVSIPMYAYINNILRHHLNAHRAMLYQAALDSLKTKIETN